MRNESRVKQASSVLFQTVIMLNVKRGKRKNNTNLVTLVFQVNLVESDWRVGNTSGRQPTSYEMTVVLSHLTSLRIRAKWTNLTTSQFTRLADIVLTLSRCV